MSKVTKKWMFWPAASPGPSCGDLLGIHRGKLATVPLSGGCPLPWQSRAMPERPYAVNHPCFVPPCRIHPFVLAAGFSICFLCCFRTRKVATNSEYESGKSRKNDSIKTSLETFTGQTRQVTLSSPCAEGQDLYARASHLASACPASDIP